jgi:hypothetical protein
VPKEYEEDKKLGCWVQTQRAAFKAGEMDPEREAKLNEIGFEFNHKGKKCEEKWNLQFKTLQDYYGKHGHCELFWAVERFTFILNAPLTLHLSLSLHCR